MKPVLDHEIFEGDADLFARKAVELIDADRVVRVVARVTRRVETARLPVFRIVNEVTLGVRGRRPRNGVVCEKGRQERESLVFSCFGLVFGVLHAGSI